MVLVLKVYGPEYGLRKFIVSWQESKNDDFLKKNVISSVSSMGERRADNSVTVDRNHH